MGLVTWTAVFTQHDIVEPQADIEGSINGFIGAELQRQLHSHLAGNGWAFCEAFPEDHGWHSTGLVPGETDKIVVSLVTIPELDEATPDGRALDGRWRVVIGVDTGWFGRREAQRIGHLKRLAGAVNAACLAIGAVDLEWEVGAP